MITSRKLFSLFLSLSLFVATGCAKNISNKHYSDDTVGAATKVYRGTVLEVNTVRVGPDELGKNRTGAVLGGVGGAVAGSAIGGGGLAGTVIGGVAGAFGGAFAEKAIKTQDAFEYVVELSNGELMSVVQGVDDPISIGAKVMVYVAPQGRSRVVRQKKE